MIEPKVYDPKIDSLVLLLFDKKIVPHFAIQTYDDGSGAMLAYIKKWSVIKHRNPSYKISYSDSHGNAISRDEFLAMVFDQPEIFEWLLFHPEWCQ